MSINLSALMKQRYDTAANWTAQNPTLLAGEIGIESDTKKWKVGTGATAWTSLVYAIGGTYPIVNADVAAGAAIVDTKLATISTALKVSNSATTAASANTASAIVARDASGNFTAGTITAALTGAASANVLKAGDTMTGVLAVTAGTAALPGIAFTGDPNTGIYSPGADQLAISTSGTGRITVDASGNVNIDSNTLYVDAVNNRVGMNTSSPNTALSVVGGIGGGVVTTTGEIALPSVATNGYLRLVGQYQSGTGRGGTIQLGGRSFSDSGNVGAFLISANSTGSFNTTDLTISTQTSFNNVISDIITVLNTGRVGIGTTSPGSALEINAAAATSPFIAKINTAERARIDSSGRLLVGTSNSGTSSATGQLRLGGTGAHSASVLLSNASQSVANSGTVDITVGTSSIIIYVGFLIVNSMNSTSNASRTQTTFSIFASPQNSSFTATQIATATGAGSSTFTVTSPSAGVIRVTNTSGGNSDIAMCFMGTGGFMG